MVMLINHHNRSHHGPVLDRMYVDRKRIFVDLLKWEVDVCGDQERDAFDDEHAAYLVVADPETERHLGSVRLLRTDRPHILGDIFPQLCEEAVPRGNEYREITRLCLAPGIGRDARRQCRNLLARSLVEFALLTGLRGYTGVAEIGWLSQILSAGWRCEALGLPRLVNAQMLGALIIHIDHLTLTRLDPAWRCPHAPMSVVDFALPTAMN